MTILLIFAFLSGLVTIAAPCIWPLLPVILSSTSTGEKKKPLGITLGIAFTFTIFTLSVSYLVRLIPFDPNVLRLFSVIVIGFLGLSLVIPKLSSILESAVSRLTSKINTGLPQDAHGFWGGFVTGSALGLVWSPCAGPILATIATLASTRAINIEVVLVTVVYVVGVSIPLLIFAQLGSRIFGATSKLNKYTGRIQQIFGVIMILTAAAIYTNYDKVLQVKLLDYFPSYSRFLVGLETNEQVQEQLAEISGTDPASGGQVFQPMDDMAKDSDTLPVLGTAPEFTGIEQWLNSEPLTLQELRGKVVLVDFWTYTCINCIRTLPYLTEWDQKYRDSGLVIVGVHTPEFEFEKKTANVEQAIEQYDIEYPVAQDNDYATWRAYNNRYWPAKYLIDAKGRVRYTHFGEGAYEETEQNIQQLLEEAGQTVETELTQEQARSRDRISPETYLGSGRMQYYYPGGSLSNGEKQLSGLQSIPINSFSLTGTWQISDEYAQAGEEARLRYYFQASQVFLVMRPVNDEDVGTVIITLDDQIISADDAGADVENGIITIDTDRLYHLVDLDETEDHVLELQFETGNIELYAFTFG